MDLEGAALGHVGGCQALPAARAFTLHLQAALGRTAAPTWAAGAREVRWGRRGPPVTVAPTADGADVFPLAWSLAGAATAIGSEQRPHVNQLKEG